MHQRKCRLIGLLVFATITLSVPRSAQAILAETTLAELAGMADHIVEAKVVGKSSSWNADQSHILTKVLLEIGESYAGSLPLQSVATVIVPGGIVEGLAMEVEHAPVFTIGEDVIVFLREINDTDYRVSGWEAGKFTIENGVIRENKLAQAHFVSQIQAAVKAAGKR